MSNFAPGLLLLLCAGVAFAMSTGQDDANTLSFSSGDRQVALLELYTSEGCSSCPPAEAWLSGLLKDPDLWRDIVPVAFHVDYWNYLGWKDPLSKSENSRRQRRYKDQGGVKSVYTPGFVLNGQEWRGWFSGKPLPTPDDPAGVLNVVLQEGELEATYTSAEGSQQLLDLQVALLGFDITTQVAGGENRGRDLTHQFAVLSHSATRSNNNTWTMRLPQSPVAAQTLALAVWVTRPDAQRPLQATGGWLQ